jgi:glutaminyl-tRNA synthetase
VELHCTYDPETKSGSGFTGRKVKGTIHWVDAKHAIPAEFRLYEPLILDEDKGESDSFLDHLNPNSVEIVNGFVENNMKEAKAHDKFQFFRHGYFNVDPKHTTKDQIVFNLIVSLKSSFEV